MSTRDAIDKTIEDLRRLIEQAVRDEQLRHWLTGLPNATALAEHIQSALEGAIGRDERFWLGFIEIDRFKSINDQFGNERANILLLEVARTIPTGALIDGDLFCPNCGTHGPRPAHAARAPTPQDITDLPPAPRPA